VFGVQQAFAQMTADKARTAGNENVHKISRLAVWWVWLTASTKDKQTLYHFISIPMIRKPA
jgi:hypothetical protein